MWKSHHLDVAGIWHFARGVAAHHAGARVHPSAWEELELLRASRHGGGAGRWLKNMSKPSTFHPRDVRRSSDKPLQQCLPRFLVHVNDLGIHHMSPLLRSGQKWPGRCHFQQDWLGRTSTAARRSQIQRNNIPDDQEMHVQILLRFNHSIPYYHSLPWLEIQFFRIFERFNPGFWLPTPGVGCVPCRTALGAGWSRVAREFGEKHRRLATRLAPGGANSSAVIIVRMKKQRVLMDFWMLFFILSSFFTGLHISLYIICCLVKSVGSVFDSSKPPQWNTMIWWVLCWLPVFLVGAGGFTLWWASSVVFTCRKPIWRSTSSSRSLNVALWYVVIWWKKTSWYMMLKPSLKPDAL